MGSDPLLLNSAMRIAIDIRKINEFGVGTYIWNLVRNLSALDDRNEYLLIGSHRNFHELGNERDPIIGNHDGTFEYKIPKRPIRKKITGLPAFTTVRGGAYFFLPGIKALRYLSTLSDNRPA